MYLIKAALFLNDMPDLLKNYLWLIVLLACAFLGIGVLIGFFAGNKSLTKEYNRIMSEQDHSDFIQKSINDNVGLGIIAYYNKQSIYCNRTLLGLTGFLHGDQIPGTIDLFLDNYDKDNQLKSRYLLAEENDINLVRVNYCSDEKVFEIKIIKNYIDPQPENGDKNVTQNTKDLLEIVLIEDVTQLKDDERRQRDLAANVSHELRTPLTVLGMFDAFVNNLSPERMPTYEELSRWCTRIVDNVNRMQDIVEDFLELSKSVQTKKMCIFEMYPMIEKAVSNIKGYPKADKVRISMPEPGAYPLCFGNPRLIVRVITNLLTNAVKYIDYEGKTDPHEIKISIVVTTDSIGVQVDDNGRGIPEKDIGHLFERFYRVDNSGSREVGGSGLGLAIAKEIADLHDGHIQVRSDVNSGSTFALFIPTARSSFERVYEDSKGGVMAEIPYYRAATYFFIREEIEAAKSKGYSDVTGFAESSNIREPFDKILDSDISKLLALLGDERFISLVEELTYVEIFDEEDEEDDQEDEIYEEDEQEELAETIETPVITPEEEKLDEEAESYATEVLETYNENMRYLEQKAEQERIEQEKEEAERLKKKELQELLMQPVVQQSIKQENKAAESHDFVKLEDKEKTLIHPNTEKKLYNRTGTKLFEGKTKTSKVNKVSKAGVRPPKINEEPEPIRSAVRQVLDEASAIDSKLVKNNDSEGTE